MASVWNKGLNISIFGESYSRGIGVVIDNFPAGVALNIEDIAKNMNLRSPFKSEFGSSGRKETDSFEILSGVYNGYTTGAPIAAIIYNKSKNDGYYEKIKYLLRPSHADYTGNIRYKGFNDKRGGGHFSGRLTALIVFAGSVCRQALICKNINIFSHIYSIGGVNDFEFDSLCDNTFKFDYLKSKSIPVLNDEIITSMEEKIKSAKSEGDSIGSTVECGVFGLEAGIGSPMFDGIENYISYIMFSIPGVKGIEFGRGFQFNNFRGSEVNDEFFIVNGKIKTKTNNSGGILGGISNGMPIIFKVVFKPTPSIKKVQNTVNIKSCKEEKIICEGLSDSCIATRGVFVVESACNIAILSQLIYQGKF